MDELRMEPAGSGRTTSVETRGRVARGSDGTGRRIVIAGAGIAGSAIAYYLTRLGERHVTVVESLGVAQGCTGLASGGMRRQFPTVEETQLSLRSDELWRSFESDNGADLGYTRNGYLILAGEDRAAEIEMRCTFQERLGADVRFLSPAEVSRRLPGVVVDDIRLAAFSPDDGFADPADATCAILDAARRSGAQLTIATVTGIETTHGRVVGVQTTGGDVACDVVIDAAGLDAPLLGSFVGLDLPISPYRQHQFLTDRLDWLPSQVPCVQDSTQDLYMRPHGAGLLLGVDDAEEAWSRKRDVNWSLAEALAEKLERRWPRLSDAGLARAWVGSYEVTPDRLPCIGQAGTTGFAYAAGFNGHGFMHGLAVGEAVAELVVTGTTSHIDLAPFDVARFDKQGPI